MHSAQSRVLEFIKGAKFSLANNAYTKGGPNNVFLFYHMWPKGSVYLFYFIRLLSADEALHNMG